MSADTPAQRLARLGIELPEPPAPAAAYQPYAEVDGWVLTAGQLPVVDGELARTGLLGRDLTTGEGAEQARLAAVNVLAVAASALGSLDAVRVVRLGVYVASADGYDEQHLVANGASELIGEVLGDAGVHARSAVGVAALPKASPVEVEATLRRR